MVPKPRPQGREAEGLQCVITLEGFERLAQPLLVPSGNTWRAYEAETLLGHLIEQGTDVFNQKPELGALRRAVIWVGD
jgi:hypothetical protein